MMDSACVQPASRGGAGALFYPKEAVSGIGGNREENIGDGRTDTLAPGHFTVRCGAETLTGRRVLSIARRRQAEMKSDRVPLLQAAQEADR